MPPEHGTAPSQEQPASMRPRVHGRGDVPSVKPLPSSLANVASGTTVADVPTRRELCAIVCEFSQLLNYRLVRGDGAANEQCSCVLPVSTFETVSLGSGRGETKEPMSHHTCLFCLLFLQLFPTHSESVDCPTDYLPPEVLEVPDEVRGARDCAIAMNILSIA